jgi:DNA-binding protein HU-beta
MATGGQHRKREEPGGNSVSYPLTQRCVVQARAYCQNQFKRHNYFLLESKRFATNNLKPPSTSKGIAMNKSDLSDAIAKQADVSKSAAGKLLDAVLSAITSAVAKGDSVGLVGFGTFKSSKRAARVGRNPQTGKELKIAATTVPKFSAGTAFKAAVSGKKAAKKK